ncbi:MAG: hypothetical protein NC225_11140 [Clostridium sp.]|nr:hypothetical protein [Clostridium sp.]MCM1400020.1 hypothetical protein [Clostridium sp.]MCM1459792.1 hypothetical protein [Bacteroides sp.]
MSYNYTVPKRKYNRISYRVMGIIFTAICVLQLIVIFRGLSKHIMLTAIFAFALGAYGIYLIMSSLRRQAFDITYTFSDEGIRVSHHYGETNYSYDDVDFITMIIPDDSMMFYMLNLKAGKQIYAIPFTMKKELCETIYELVNSHIPERD